MHTIVDKKHLPLEIASPNVMVVPYTTNVLFPKLGPLAVKRYVRIVARLLTDYAAMIKASELEKKGVGKRKGRPGGQAFRSNPAFLDTRHKAGVQYETLLDELKHFNRSYLYGGVAARLTEVANVGAVTEARLRSTPDLSGTLHASRMAGAANIVNGGLGLSLGRLGNINTGLDFNVIANPGGATIASVAVAGDGRLIDGDNSPAQVMLPGGAFVKVLPVGPTDTTLTKEQVEEQQKAQQKSYDTALLYAWMARPNAVASDLFAQGAIAQVDTIFSKEVLLAADSGKVLGKVLSEVADQRKKDLETSHPEYTDARLKEVGRLVDAAFVFLAQVDVDLGTIPERYQEEARFKSSLIKYVITRIDTVRPISDKLVPLPSDTDIVESREWAFQRSERLDITMGTPTLRGPIAAEGVTPNSELTISESDFVEQFEGFQTSQSEAYQRGTRDAGLSVSGFQLALSSLTESGTISDNAFQTDTALVSTLKERRRERINEVVDTVSRTNGSQSISSTRSARSRSREYVTAGKDDVFSSTEVTFQVGAKANIEVFLEDVDLVWCPRVEVPFIYLHRIVLDERNRAEGRYLTQNQVSDPTRPTLRYETESFTFEKAIMGDEHYQTQSFSEQPPSNISGSDDQGGEWEIDRAASEVRFRNGDSDDYNWKDRGNWDDLEVHNEEFTDGPRLSPMGLVEGSAFLETTDPEYWNKGFMVYTIVMRRLTAGTVTALAEWERTRTEVVSERQSVTVRAKQYGEMKMREMITRFENTLEQRSEVFSSLIKLVYAGISSKHRSFYAETISSSINWSRASMTYEQPDLTNLPFPEFPPKHFMNVSHVRLVLPIDRNAEQAFFDSLANADNYHAAAAADVQGFIKKYRARLETLKTTGEDKLDSYSREMVLGRHVESVLSHHPFSE